MLQSVATQQSWIEHVYFEYIPFTFTYIISGCTTNAKLLGNVHGVVVHAIILTSGDSSSGKLIITENIRKITNLNLLQVKLAYEDYYLNFECCS